MGGIRADRLWGMGGCFGIVILLLLSWLLFIGPQYAETTSLAAQTTAEQDRVVSLTRRITSLRQQNERLAEYTAQLAKDRQALPTEEASADFLRQVNAAATTTSVSVTAVYIKPGSPQTAAGVQLYALEIGVEAVGRAADLDRFFEQVQQVQPRAILINSVVTNVDERGPDMRNVKVSMQAYMTTPPGTMTGAPANATDAD